MGGFAGCGGRKPYTSSNTTSGAQALRAAERAYPAEHLFEHDPENEGALLVIEMGNAQHHGRRLAVDRLEPFPDIEVDALAPSGKSRGSEQAVERGRELASLGLLEERLDG